MVEVLRTLHRQFGSRVVIPITLSENLGKQPLPRLNPVLTINGKEYVVLTQQLAAVPVDALGPKVSSGATHRAAFVDALDLLINGI